jgi:hypothetical protein
MRMMRIYSTRFEALVERDIQYAGFPPLLSYSQSTSARRAEIEMIESKSTRKRP